MFINNVKCAINDILNKPFLSLIMIIQLSVALVFFYDGTKIVISNMDKISQIKSSFNVKSIYAIEDLSDSENLLKVKLSEKDIVHRMNKFENEMQNSKDFICVRFNHNPIAVKTFDGCEDFANFIIDSSEKNGIEFSCVNVLNGDKKYFETFKYKIEKGRYFIDSDFVKSDSIPVILGSDYMGKFNIGDKIPSLSSDSDEIVNLKVIGFLKKGCYFFQSTFAPEGVFKTDNFILVPMFNMNKIETKEDVIEELGRFWDTMIISNINEKKLLNEINSKTEKLDLFNIGLDNGKELLKEYKDNCTYQMKLTALIFGTIIIFTSINIITSIINYFMKKKKEFAINMMCGASNKDLVLRIVFQNIIIFTISYILMIILNRIINEGTNFIWYDSRMSIITIILCIILIIINSLIPIIKINRVNLNKIIKED